jgi:nucleotide-binding universal stress UspA family protein
MRETAAYDMGRFRWHTGATLRPLATGEPCPVLFRDVGPAALALFLRGGLRRLAGPLSPIVYMRTAAYVEPYTDHERIGRLVFLRPLDMLPWHSGLSHIYVSRAVPGVDALTVGFVPGDVALDEAAQRARGLADVRSWREILGGWCYDDAAAETLSRLDQLAEELNRTEERAAPLRQRLQSAEQPVRGEALAAMERAGLTESDLCTAWHHLPRERRGWIEEALRKIARRGDA